MQPLNTQRINYVEFLTPFFKKNDFAITLTFKDYLAQYSPKFTPNYDMQSKDIHHLLNVINYKIYGRNYKKGRSRLKNAHVFEHSAYGGFHVHMILENPLDWKIPEVDKKSLILDSWANMKNHGYYNANKVNIVHDTQGWISYCFKNITHLNSERCDINNWFL